MSLTWTVDPEQPPAYVHVSGSLTLGPQLHRFSREMTALLSGNVNRGLLLDLTATAEIDSAGLGELVILYTTAGQAGCPLCLVAPGRRVSKLLDITRLRQLFPQFGDKAVALAWVRQQTDAIPPSNP
jgi:anti-anti-sigma factor